MRELPPVGPSYPASPVRRPEPEKEREQQRAPARKKKTRRGPGDQDDAPRIDEYA